MIASLSRWDCAFLGLHLLSQRLHGGVNEKTDIAHG
jgi:hypothetical protein